MLQKKLLISPYNTSLPTRLLVGTSVVLVILGICFFLWHVMGSTVDVMDPNNSGVVQVLDADTSVKLKERICNLAGSACVLLKRIYWNVLGTMGWLYLIPAILVAFVIFLVESKRQGERLTFSRFSRFCFPKSVFFHKSAKVDCGYYLTLFIVGPLTPVFSMIIPSTVIATYVVKFYGILNTTGQTSTLSATWIDRMLYSILLFMVADFGYFVFHYLVHKIPLLWEFHKVHHSAQVLIPVTALRMHPVDGILQDFFVGLMIGIFNGVYAIIYSEQITAFTIYNVSAIIFFYQLTNHLRHSHIWLHYGWTLSHVFSSPAQHQIHHSQEDRHIDKNFGLVLSLWDWMAGTLYVPRGKEQFSIGLQSQEDEEYQTVSKCYFRPFIKIARQLSESRLKTDGVVQ
jgi:sterol desaturase/sphingolipid hydroxylase (fatty acid hydroxylase superfamily)